MAKICGFLRAHWKWLLGATFIGTTVLCLIIFSNPHQLSKYQAMADRGDISACIAEMYSALSKKPDWHQGRAFLADLEIKQGQIGSAAGHVLILAEAGLDTNDLETALNRHWGPELETVLEQALNLEWHWPRISYIRAAIYGHDYAKALSQMAVLANLGAETDELENLFLSRVARSEIPSLLAAMDTSQPWSKVFALSLALQQSDLDNIHEAWQELWLADPTHPLVTSVRQEALTTKNYALAWKLAEISGDSYDDIIRAMYSLDRNKLQIQLEKLDDNPELNVLRCAFDPDPVVGLIEIERQGYVPKFRDLYARFKLEILYDNQSMLSAAAMKYIDLEDLQAIDDNYSHEMTVFLLNASGLMTENPSLETYRNNLFVRALNSSALRGVPMLIPHEALAQAEPRMLWYLVLDWVDYHINYGNAKPAIDNALDYLIETPGWRLHAQNLRTILNPPAPPAPWKTISLAKLPGYCTAGGESLSPNANFLLYGAADHQYGFDMTLVNLTTFQRVSIFRNQGSFPVTSWSPSSKYLAVRIQDSFILHDLSDLARTATVDLNYGYLLGWQDDNSLYYCRYLDGKTQVYLYTIGSNSSSPVGAPRNGQPSLTPQGELAWLEATDTKLSLILGGEVRQYPLGHPDEGTQLFISHWLPDSSGLVLAEHGPDPNADVGYMILNLNGNITSLEARRFFPLTWLDDYRVYGTYLLDSPYEEGVTPTRRIALLDIRDMSVTATGLDGMLRYGYVSGKTKSNSFGIWSLSDLPY